MPSQWHWTRTRFLLSLHRETVLLGFTWDLASPEPVRCIRCSWVLDSSLNPSSNYFDSPSSLSQSILHQRHFKPQDPSDHGLSASSLHITQEAALPNSVKAACLCSPHPHIVPHRSNFRGQDLPTACRSKMNGKSSAPVIPEVILVTWLRTAQGDKQPEAML